MTKRKTPRIQFWPLKGVYKRPKSLRGRTPKVLDPAVRAIILDDIAQGSMIWVACRKAGIGTSTYRRWKAQGIKDIEKGRDSPYRAFWAECEEALAAARADAEKAVKKKNPEFWLTRGPGKSTGDPDRPGWDGGIEITGPDKGPIEVEITDPERIRKVLGHLKDADALPDTDG